jgi:hypothetical protein
MGGKKRTDPQTMPPPTTGCSASVLDTRFVAILGCSAPASTPVTFTALPRGSSFSAAASDAMAHLVLPCNARET